MFRMVNTVGTTLLTFAQFVSAGLMQAAHSPSAISPQAVSSPNCAGVQLGKLVGLPKLLHIGHRKPEPFRYVPCLAY